MKRLVLPLLIALLALTGSGRSEAQSFEELRSTNWHHWRGPEARGVSRTAKPPTSWSENSNVRWKVPIDGHGSSTPIVWKDRIYLLTAIDTGRVDPSLPRPEDQPKRVFGIIYPNTEHDFIVLCLDRKTGKELWRKTATTRIPHEGHHGDNDFASASPTTDGERLFCWFGSAGLYCYDLEGRLFWQRDLGKAYMEASLGEGCSPVVYGDRLVIVRDQRRQSSIEVLDTKSGFTEWKKDREEPGAWATPLVVEHDGRVQVITSASKRVRSYDLRDGSMLWECGGLTGNVTPSPVLEDGVVYCMSGYKGYSLLALPISATGDITGSDAVRWSKRRGTPYVPSPLLYDGMLYYLQSNRGILSCVDAKTGQAFFDRARVPELANVYASPVGAGGRVYLTERNGTTVVLKRSQTLEVLATNLLDDRINASPALVGDEIFLRGRRFLYCVGETAPEQTFEIPATDDGLPGAGPIRRYEWFRELWQRKRSGWARDVAGGVPRDRGAVVFLGDSITQGWGPKLGGAFPGMKVANRGISGDTTRGMLIRLEEDVLSLEPKAVVLLMGTNDLEEGAEPATIAGNFKLIVEALEAHRADMPIVVSLVMPSAASKKRPAEKIQAVNALYRAAVRGNPRVTVLDTWTLFAAADGDARKAEFPDLLHPNKLGYAKWAAALRPIFATLGFLETSPDEFEPEQGFIPLFNGRDLTGWGFRPTPPRRKPRRPNPNRPVFVEIKEAVVFDGKSRSSDGRYVARNDRLIVTTPAEGRRIQQLWTTREFSKDFILKLEFRATPNADSGIFIRGKQLQCRDYPLAGPYKDLERYRPQDWNEVVIEVKGTTAHCTCNGEVLEAAFEVPESGPIGLEGDRGQMEYRRIRIRER